MNGRHYQLVTELQGFGAVVGAISHNLADLQDLQHHQGNYISIYDHPALSHPVFSHLHSRLYAMLLWFTFWTVYEVFIKVGTSELGINYWKNNSSWWCHIVYKTIKIRLCNRFINETIKFRSSLLNWKYLSICFGIFSRTAVCIKLQVVIAHNCFTTKHRLWFHT